MVDSPILEPCKFATASFIASGNSSSASLTILPWIEEYQIAAMALHKACG